ncbi:cell wall-binding repeat-containing protein [Desulfosporosinus nitroreducens]|uniref:cell wall-binding repeat-containing protein n=1 Tax=Desulfosporosinus nitroreducens TaxID=2018668 RepID=UPI00207D4C2C|nr:cell wall-binding repeat-containing protein [Desulfosporosinus nitroreducens]MCO1602739.1 cell wall-binding repeat-containing protein [Desulfosporosinus nitroreducens]
MIIKPLRKKLLSSFIVLFFTGTILSASVVSYSKPAFGADTPDQSRGASLSTVSAGIAHSLAISSDGTVWAWGDNSEGQLGNNSSDLQNSPTPVQVSDLTNVVAVAAGGAHSLALKKDGTVWGWGTNELFQLGDRTNGENWSTPLQISGLNNVHAIVAGTYLSLVLKTDGTVWAWGGNLWGQLGDAVPFEEEPASMNPVQVKGLTNVTGISSGLGFVIARQNGGNIWTWGGNSDGQLGNNTYGGPIVTGDISDPEGELISGVNSPVKSLIQVGSFQNTSLTRLSGFDAMETSVKISQEGWPNGASTAILATVVNFPDALAAAPLAHQYDAPVLLTESKHLTTAVELELGRLKPSKVIIVGGTAVVSKEVEDLLKQQYEVTRLSGYDQYETAAQIANYLHFINPEISGKVVIAYGGNFPDALAISSWAAYQGIPILLTEQGKLPQATKTALQDLNVTETIVVGGTAVVSAQVEAQLTGVKRYAGIDQYQTGIAIANGLGNSLNSIYLATGDNFPDALAGSALAARTGSPIILVDKYLNSTAVTNFLMDHNLNIKKASILGGTAVITPTVFEKITRFFTL